MPNPAATSLPKDKVVTLYRTALKAGIPLETVHQKVAHLEAREQLVETVEKADQAQRKALPLKKRILLTVTPIFCLVLGLGLVGSAVWPLFSYYFFSPDDLFKSSLLAPIPREQVLDVMPHIVVQAQETQERNGESSVTYVAPTILNDDLDYTNLSNWFPNFAVPTVDESKTVEYTFDVPDVNIFNAKVRVGGSSLDKNVIHYPGTAMPGDPGSPVIFGHSILRQFYNPSEKNPNRYLSIFSTIMTLKKGAKIYVTMGNVKYTYQVVEKRVVHPEDTYILQQQFDDKQLKLVTCVPEGTTQDRGVVIAQLVKGE
jgi:LPXTG-site transpeptidase (sortase) family protein